MDPGTPQEPAFKRQVVFRIGAEDWTLLQAAARAHGSIQAALVAALRSLAASSEAVAEPSGSAAPSELRPDARRSGRTPAASPPPPSTRNQDEIPSREAAKILGLKAGTVRGYIRAGRLPGRYDGEPDYRGWLTTRGAVDAYRRQHRK